LDNTFTPTTVSQFFTYIPPAVDITSHGSSNPEKATDTNSVKVSEAGLGEKKAFNGAVVGGVIGGIAVVAVILGIILLWIQRKKRVDKSRRRERPKIRLVG
jgi:hypothetical protein